MPAKCDPSALWVALNERGEGNMFHVYPKILSELLMQEDAARVPGNTSEAEKLVLPSDKEWRVQQYFMLVDMQKKAAESQEGDDDPEQIKKTGEPSVEIWAPWNLVLPMKNPNAPPPVAVKTSPGPAWDITLVLKAARLLIKPPHKVDFVDEQDMRLVYSIIYDVFRYKTVLDKAIESIEFFDTYPLLNNYRNIVWLFLMELARRQWMARTRAEVDRADKLLQIAGSPYTDIEQAVWEQRVHFAAAIAKIRIKNRAFTLSELLPQHLREEKIYACVHKTTVTGWVNTFKTKKIASLIKRLHDLGYSYSNSRQLCAGEYRFDRVCPRFITLRPPSDIGICQLDLVRDGIIVLQEREFCEGASTLCRALRVNSLQGAVAQTHASSPRCSAYLAAQLRELAAVIKSKGPQAPVTPELGKLVVFGAGENVSNYIGALQALGVEASAALQSGAPVCVISEPVYCDTPTVINALDGVVAVLATPPNSYSSVTDPIDLVCGRGGDLAMLEVLTETEIDTTGKERVQAILEEQKKTLKTLLSKPQIQLILYETHSALEAENQVQVTRAVAEANRLAREKHSLLRKKYKEQSPRKKDTLEIPTDSITTISDTISRSEISKDERMDFATEELSKTPYSQSIVSPSTRPTSADTVLKKQTDPPHVGTRPGAYKTRPIPETAAHEDETMPHDPDKDAPDVSVPDCDLFEIGQLPNLGNGLDINFILDRDGCYLGLIQRKEIVRLDAQYMIRVAEDRGLFGQTPPAAPARRKQADSAAAAPRRRRRKQGFEVERVSAPTYSSMVRSCRRGSAPASYPAGVNPPEEEDLAICSKHARRQAAACNIAAAACSCDARHRRQIRTRRASTGMAPRIDGPPNNSACRRPFPVAVHEVQLRTLHTASPATAGLHKIYAS